MKFAMNKMVMIVAFAAASVVGVFGQDVTMTRAEFEKVLTDSNKAVEGMPYRQTSVFEEIVNGVAVPEKARQEVLEVIGEDRTRQIDTSIVNGKPQRSERVEIGDKAWTKMNNGRWKELNFGSSGEDTADIVASESFSSKGKAILSGVEYRMYEKIQKLTVTQFGKIIRERTATTVLWINQKGICTKYLYKLEDANNNISRQTATTEYNPKDLKIEIPIK